MPWIEFEKSEKELEEMFTQIFNSVECIMFETYSVPNFELREFDSSEGLNTNIMSLFESHSTQLSVWCSDVMPRPMFRDTNLRAGGSRQTVDGCGLFNIQLEVSSERNSFVGKVGYFTEVAANNKYTGLNGPELVCWENHKQASRKIRKAILQTGRPANKSSKKDALTRASS